VTRAPTEPLDASAPVSVAPVNGAPMTADDRDIAELASALRHSVLRLTRRLRSQRADISITITQLMALATLRKSGPMSAGELAAHERVQPPSMTKILAVLEEHGLARREQHPSDRRQIVIECTDAGSALIEKEGQLREAFLAVRIAKLSKADRALLARASLVLERLAGE
jgi:DNA-binding MarR family transcriptional regulator